ncbi:CotS family spore coat protein [Clostridium sp. BSD9I1]|uniref:CotS family spore coat protein n=1 Tax=Clostridium sp. BSD9I1 TaxID=2003589 RepID=UPI001646442D|nr:CotS family spore coat protein [Clostridium sp. BSD9I1]
MEVYDEKLYLCGYALDTELFNKFDVEIYDIYPLRSVFFVSTNKGNKILKKIDYSMEELTFIYNGLEYIKKKFSRVMNFHQSKDGEIFISFEGQVYCLIDLVEGMECDFNNPIDISIAARGLAEMHSASEGFRCKLVGKDNNGKLIDNFKRRIDEMKFFKRIAEMHENKNEFDINFLKYVDFYIKEIEESIEILEGSCYYKLCSEEDKKVLCHHDLAYHNIIIKDNEAYFIDFDYAMIDLKVHDLANFTLKVIKDFAFDLEKAKVILNEYMSINPIESRELKVLYGILKFPEEIYSICRDYYGRRKNWTNEVFIDRLNKKIEKEEFRQEFLNEFKAVCLV